MTRKNTSTAAPTADTDSENKLWIAANNYVLSLCRYVDSEAEKGDVILFEEKYK